jgi:hypothetical protein
MTASGWFFWGDGIREILTIGEWLYRLQQAITQAVPADAGKLEECCPAPRHRLCRTADWRPAFDLQEFPPE